MRENPEKFLPTVQIGITVFGTLASALAGVVSIHFLNPVIKELPYVGRFSESVSLIIVVLCLTYLLLVLGELVPKHIGINYREKVAITIAPMFDFLSRVLFFPVRLLNVSSSVIMRLLHLRQLDEPVTEDEIKLLL